MYRPLKKILCISALAISFAAGPAGAQKKVGLALSGGGARGLAHIGVLKVLEEEGLQAEIVTGTSMGSIVGGLYAAGYSPAFLEEMATGVDWFDMFLETVDRRYVTMHQKILRDRYLAAFPIENRRISLPSGIIKGQKIHRLFYQLCWPVAEVYDFSEFPRAFRCVATDIATGEAVVLDRGHLADAMRTSMAIPSAFSPVESGGRLLVDGGLVRNIPAEDAVRLGADLVICVDVTSEPVGKDSLNSLVDIVDQTLDILMQANTDAQKAHCDLYIRPQLSSIGTLDFSDVQMIIDRGEEAARRHIDEIRELVDAAGGFREPPAQMQEVPDTRVEIIDVRIEGLSGVPEDLVRSLLGVDPPEKINAGDMDDALRRLYSTGYFERISYRLDPDGSGRTLVLEIEEETADYIGLGLRYDSRWSFSALLGAQWKNLIGNGSMLNIDMILSRRVDMAGAYTIDAGLGRYFAPGVAAKYVDDYIYDYSGDTRTSRWGVRAGRAGLIVESARSYWLRIMIGAGGEWYSIRPDIAPASEYAESGSLAFARGDFWIDTLDRSWMPRRGISMRVSGQYFFEAASLDNDYHRIFGHAVAALPVYRSLSLRGTFLYGMTGGGTPLPHHNFYLGGILSWFDFYGSRDVSLYGFKPFEFSGANAYLAGGDLQLELAGRWLLAGHFSMGAVAGRREDVFGKENTVTGWGGTVAYDTPVGPAELTLSGSEDASLDIWFGFGYRF